MALSFGTGIGQNVDGSVAGGVWNLANCAAVVLLRIAVSRRLPELTGVESVSMLLATHCRQAID